ncbi:UTP--glucose-1-phosphate uridylyltransferase DI49_4836 [Saccharomyces eubayanus]|uniref:UTP--glucose-1-phosphate uridylyltransferase n=1 Tax=Saccharomyces eubayanus TaxID=1080349 RepID=UPI0006C4B626|nr:hypothetical protein DI49_4836 [Saccharomyces eubayanus]KOG96507.1 hypothetical protein DI49_4836 [Saccharomyces eubayanus]
MTVFSSINEFEYNGTFEGIRKDVIVSQMIKALQKRFPSICDKNYELSLFLPIFQRYILENSSITHELDSERIRLLNITEFTEFEDIQDNDALDDALLTKLATVKLNDKVDSVIGKQSPLFEVKNGKCSLDIILQQIQNLNILFNCDVPLIFITTPETESQISDFLKESYPCNKVEWKTLVHSSFPAIDKDTLLPAVFQMNVCEDDLWYPCGSGNLIDTLYFSGELDNLIVQGKEVLFVSNMENLGATVDLNILSYMITNDINYLVEVVDRTANDSNTGVLATYESTLRLVDYKYLSRESARKCRTVNTNNIWINLRKLKNLIESDSLNLPICSSATKTVISNSQFMETLHLQTHLGDCIGFFSNSQVIKVPRNRFLPLATCEDLFLLKSNLYDLDTSGILSLYPLRFELLPSIKLGDEFDNYGTFKIGIPDIPNILELDHLTVTGNVFFGRKIILRGTVIIICDEDDVITIPDGSILENVIVRNKSQLEDIGQF